MGWIQTSTGRRVDLLRPDPDQIDPVDIAHALSNQCRFNGHCKRFYSVAEHSLLGATATLPDRELARYFLLHDATEAYLGDIVSPLKGLLPSYEELEHDLWLVIAVRFGLHPRMPDEIKEIDRRMLATEREQVMSPPGYWECKAEPFPNLQISFLEPMTARTTFLQTFRSLFPQENIAS